MYCGFVTTPPDTPVLLSLKVAWLGDEALNKLMVYEVVEQDRQEDNYSRPPRASGDWMVMVYTIRV